MTDERKVSERYRELRREEPPRALDDAILAAARRAAETRPAPLVVPTGRRRWYFPLAAAAVIVLAVAVTMHVEREQPGEEIVTAPVEPPKEARERTLADAAKSQPQPQPERAPKAERSYQYAPDPKPAAAPPAQTDTRAAQDVAGAVAAQRAQAEASARAEAAQARDSVGVQSAREAAPAAPAAAPAARSDNYTAPRAGARPEANEQSRMLAKLQSQSEPARLETLARSSPEQWLQGIADLKRQGRHDEAEKQLAEFRKRYPDYRIPEAILEKFERR